ncbi:uncharacterized protein [Aegilops tauschii subsp. strangulata]|uniref:uncharacterized protein n=1 Tax=Aegilops tauschii subsp. strangulata TaxID=200361 RepID=UPI001ABCC104|nr:uncharacterized protein LOC109751705 [Aegilops tauschii subsp. strangulata]
MQGRRRRADQGSDPCQSLAPLAIRSRQCVLYMLMGAANCTISPYVDKFHLFWDQNCRGDFHNLYCLISLSETTILLSKVMDMLTIYLHYEDANQEAKILQRSMMRLATMMSTNYKFNKIHHHHKTLLLILCQR